LHTLRHEAHLDLVAWCGESILGRDLGSDFERTREASCSKVGASVVSGSSSFEHHTPVSPSHSVRIPKLFRCRKLVIRRS
jgi:hypothetical protein